MASDYLPYFKFFPRDYLSSPSVMAMTLEEEGCFIRMLACQWLDGSVSRRALRGLLSMDDERIAELLAGPVGEVFDCEGDLLVNPRLSAEREQASHLIESRRRAGKASGTARRGLNTSSTNANTSGTKPNNTDTDTDTNTNGKKRRMNAVDELEAAVETWERLSGPMPARLRKATSDFLAARKAQRRKLWTKEMWLLNLTNEFTPNEHALAFETAIRSGWGSVHPHTTKGRTGRGNDFAAIVEAELEAMQQEEKHEQD